MFLPRLQAQADVRTTSKPGLSIMGNNNYNIALLLERSTCLGIESISHMTQLHIRADQLHMGGFTQGGK